MIRADVAINVLNADVKENVGSVPVGGCITKKGDAVCYSYFSPIT